MNSEKYVGEEEDIQIFDGSIWRVVWLNNETLRIIGKSTPPAKPQEEPPSESEKTLPQPAEKEDDDNIGDDDLWNEDDEEEEYEEEPTELVKTTPELKEDEAFKARLRSVMTDNMFDRKVRNRKRGNLDMHHLWRANTGATNIFTQKQARKGKQYNIVLLVDQSGSMQESPGGISKIERAADIATFLAHHFHKINIDLAIVGFNGFVMVHKEFDEIMPDLNLLHSILVTGASTEGNSWNDDYDGLAKSYELLKNKKGKNFVIMISDGQPADWSMIDTVLLHPETVLPTKTLGPKTYTFWMDTSTKLNSIQRNDIKVMNQLVKSKEPEIESFGIGIGTACRQIPNNKTINSVEELKPEILKYLSEKIRRG